MRYDSEHKRRTHERVVHEASEAIRRHGPDGIGIAALMADAGLTHGGFYAHFKSKDALIAESVVYMFDDRFAALQKDFDGVTPAEGLGRYIDRYLSVRHRDNREKGCPVAALSADLARTPVSVRHRFEAGVERLIDALTETLHAIGRPQPRALAMSMLSEMAGAVAMARGVTDAALSEEILDAARASVKRRAGLPA